MIFKDGRANGQKYKRTEDTNLKVGWKVTVGYQTDRQPEMDKQATGCCQLE